MITVQTYNLGLRRYTADERFLTWFYYAIYPSKRTGCLNGGSSVWMSVLCPCEVSGTRMAILSAAEGDERRKRDFPLAPRGAYEPAALLGRMPHAKD